jgi:hypothetical protein
MKQASLLNKQLALLRANQISNPQDPHPKPLDNVTNILNTASSLLTQTSNTTSANKENVPKAATIGSKRDPKPLPRAPVTGKIIRLVDSDGNLILRTKKIKNNAQ